MVTQPDTPPHRLAGAESAMKPQPAQALGAAFVGRQREMALLKAGLNDALSGQVQRPAMCVLNYNNDGCDFGPYLTGLVCLSITPS